MASYGGLDTNKSSRQATSLMMKHNHEGIGIVSFLQGKTLLITGATGFLGMVLVEKILRSVADIDKLYLLIKARNKEAAMERLNSEIIDADVFKCLKQKYGQSYQQFMLSKLVPVVGNTCESDLGLETTMADVISRQVHVIINSAANTTFNER
ncbi:conserved hypothetical protein [Ricinus communis]|uniref:Fatty acyl-CoA reductase n=1 Tax=Ricinus communis TaxID=3988 RepID=B9TNC2_RICCO|nr:conserved hypothetical protein [Ricinus communis]